MAPTEIPTPPAPLLLLRELESIHLLLASLDLLWGYLASNTSRIRKSQTFDDCRYRHSQAARLLVGETFRLKLSNSRGLTRRSTCRGPASVRRPSRLVKSKSELRRAARLARPTCGQAARRAAIAPWAPAPPGEASSVNPAGKRRRSPPPFSVPANGGPHDWPGGP